MRSLRTATAALLVVALSASPALACKRDHQHKRSQSSTVTAGWQRLLYGDATVALRRAAARAEVTKAKRQETDSEPVDLSAYEGLASWVDIFNHKPWSSPKNAVRTMAKRGAKAIFLQTSTYGQSKALYDKEAIDAYLYHAHRRGMKVVAWYVPTFNQQGIDFERSKRAIRYRSPSGHRFDSFGLDIEATHVSDISLRNKRLIKLSKRLRRVAGPSYPLSAITPDPVIASYWPNFPYKQVGRIYDVIVPMGYWTFRARGFKEVRDYTAEGVRNIKRAVGKKDVPIHFIGGIADDAGPSDLRGFTKAAREHDLIGASLYDYPITDRRSWFEMRALSEDVAKRRRQEAIAAREAEEERRRLARKERREDDKRKGSKKAKKPGKKGKDGERQGKAKNNKDASAKNKRGGNDKKKRPGGKDPKERRKSSSSASRPGSTSSRADARERLHLRALSPSFPRS